MLACEVRGRVVVAMIWTGCFDYHSKTSTQKENSSLSSNLICMMREVNMVSEVTTTHYALDLFD